MPPAGLEPAPRGLKGRRSNQLSYRGRRLDRPIPRRKIAAASEFYGLASTAADRP